jgi:hypothetical protein
VCVGVCVCVGMEVYLDGARAERSSHGVHLTGGQGGRGDRDDRDTGEREREVKGKVRYGKVRAGMLGIVSDH